MRVLLLSLGILFASELQVQGNLKVTGTVDANGNPITNVGEPVLITDVATANYVNTRTAGKGRIIALKCGWTNRRNMYVGNGVVDYLQPSIGSCEPPSCPEGWLELGIGSETTGGTTFIDSYSFLNGNSIRYCMEQEDEE